MSADKDAVLSAFRQCAGDAAGPSRVARVLRFLDPNVWTDANIERLLAQCGGSSDSQNVEELLGWIFETGPVDPMEAAKLKAKSAMYSWLEQEASGPEIVFVLGGPGSGKGTFSSKVVDQFGYKHLSAGDLLRAERARPGSQVAVEIESCIKDGKLVPSSVTVGLLEDEMRRQGWEGGKYLVDGFPRSLENYQAWDNQLGKSTQLKFCFSIECSEPVMMQRLLKRGETSGRSDDNAETIKKRFVTFQAESMPVITAFADKGLVRTVNSDPGIENVWGEVEAIFR